MPRNATHRRQFLKAAGATGATLSLAGCTSSLVGGGGSSPSESDPLVVGIYGGVFKDVLDDVLVTPFQEETGIAIKSRPQQIGDNMLKLKKAVENGESPVDVPIVAPDPRILGQKDKLNTWLYYDPSDLSNIDNAVDSLIQKGPDGQLFGVGGFGWFLCLSSNTNQVDEPLDTWKALWNSDYENNLGVNRLPGDSFLLDITAELFFDGRDSLKTQSDIQKVFDKAAEVKDQVSLWWAEEAEAQSPLRKGDLAATQMYNDVTLVMKDKGAPVEPVFPKEGALLNFGSWTITRSTDYPDAAKRFIDYSLRPDVQDSITKNLFTAPTIKQSKLNISDDLYEKVYGPGPDAAMRPFNRMYVERQEWINEQWKQQITN